jgi:hypothetical protein
MNCEPTKTPGNVDILALRKKYRQERDKRLNLEGGRQYVQVAGEFHDIYATDPQKPVHARETELRICQLSRMRTICVAVAVGTCSVQR